MARLIAALERFHRQPLWRIALFLEGFGWLVFARLLLWLLPFKYLSSILKRPVFASRPASMDNEGHRKNIRWAIQTAAPFLPGETACFPRGIAAHFMCRIHGMKTTLFYGAAIAPDGTLRAHVWAEDDLNGVIGHSEASSYQILAEFPGHV